MSCNGKIRHETIEMAQAHLRGVAQARNQHPARAKLLNVYRCGICQGFHVGHTRKYRTRRRHGQGTEDGRSH